MERVAWRPVHLKKISRSRRIRTGRTNWERQATAHHEKTRNGTITALPSKSLEVTQERRRKSPCMSVEEDRGEHESIKSVSRVEDSLRVSQEAEAYQSSTQQSFDVTKNKHTQSQIQSGSRSSRIKDTYFLFGKQRKKRSQLLADEMDNQKKQVNKSITTNSFATMERRVFWVGESSKNSKREELKNIRSVLSQISNSVSDTTINNCNRLFWLKHGSLETIKV